MSLQAEAASLGIPMHIEVTDELRYSDCDAVTGNLAAIEGKHAIYRGECANQHQYEFKRLVSELQAERTKKLTIKDGKLSYGLDEGFVAGPLEEL